MRGFSKGLTRGAVLLGTVLLFACGGGEKEIAQQPEKVCPTCPVCNPTPSPAAEEDLINKFRQGLVKKFAVRMASSPEKIEAAATKYNILDKIGRKELAPGDFPVMASFLWEVDPEFRIHQLRAMVAMNRVVDLLKPTVGPKFDPKATPKDPESEDISQLLSEAIVAQAQVQRLIEEDLMGLGIENVHGIKPGDDMPAASGMMTELLSFVAPPEATPQVVPPAAAPLGAPQATPQATPKIVPKPVSASLDMWSWLEPSAEAQALATPKGKLPAAAPTHSKAIVRVKMKTAPMLLARTLSYDVGGKSFVLQSPFGKAAAEFQSIPFEQFQFKVEKQTVGPEYRDAVDALVQSLAAKPQRDMNDWWELSHAIVELRLLNQLVDYNKISLSAPSSPPSGPLIIGPSSGTDTSSPKPAAPLVLPPPTQPGGVPPAAALPPLKPDAGVVPPKSEPDGLKGPGNPQAEKTEAPPLKTAPLPSPKP